MRAAVALLLLALAACGGSPAGPTPTTTTTLPQPSARDGWTGDPVAATFATNAGTVTVTAAGYLQRVAHLTAEPLFLWPQEEAYVRALVYGNTPPQLYRWDQPSFNVTAPDEAGAAIDAALVEIQRVTGIAARRSTTGEVVVTIDPSHPFFVANPGKGAAAFIHSRGATIVSGEIVYLRADQIGAATLHELGHIVGLTHTVKADDVMYGLSGLHPPRFSDAEAVALRLMYQHRTAGNLAPDREAGVAAASGVARTIVVVD